MREAKRKKIITYLHPDIYEQDALTESYISNLPSQTRGEFNRNALICGAALSSIDPRIVTIISAMYSKDITVDNVVSIIEQITGYKSSLPQSMHKEERKSTDTHQDNNALQNLKSLKK